MTKVYKHSNQCNILHSISGSRYNNNNAKVYYVLCVFVYGYYKFRCSIGKVHPESVVTCDPRA